MTPKLISFDGIALGWKRDSIDTRDFHFRRIEGPRHLPSAVDLRPDCVPHMDQLTLGSCVPHGVTACLRYTLMKEGVKDRPLSRLQCFPGETSIQLRSEVSGASRRFYQGDMLVFRTASDKSFSCTPNHPILTTSGWRTAHAINVGDQVISIVGIKASAPSATDANDQNAPATIEEVANSTLMRIQSSKVPVSSPDFHGDGVGSKIAIVGTNGQLVRKFKTALGEALSDLSVEGGHIREGLLLNFRTVNAFVLSVFAPFGSELSVFNQLATPSGTGFIPYEFNSIGLRTYRRAVLSQDAADNGVAGTKRSGNLSSGVSREVIPEDGFADCVVFRGVERFSGQVFNLQTASGWYVANGVVSHNCYYDGRVVENCIKIDSGLEIRDAIKCAADLGVAVEPLWPYNIDRFRQKPFQRVYDNALKFRALTYKRVSPDASSIKAAIASGWPVVGGFNCYNGFVGSECARTGVVSMPGTNEAPVGGHCTYFPAYGQRPGYITGRNSWGPDWGDKGDFYMPEEYLEQYGSDYWIITKVGLQ